MGAKAGHGPDAEEGTDGEAGEGEMPTDSLDHGRHEVDRGKRQKKPDARLHGQHGANGSGLGEFGNRGRELGRISNYDDAPEKGERRTRATVRRRTKIQ